MGFLRKLFGVSSDDGPKDSVGTTKPSSVADYTTTDSGLEFADLKVGDGLSPSKGQQVTVHYTGWLTSGKRFDSSVVKKKPFSFNIGQRRVIKGWDEGVLSMKVGGIRQLRVPPGLGYGAGGHPPVIPKNATLIFEVQLLSIETH